MWRGNYLVDLAPAANISGEIEFNSLMLERKWTSLSADPQKQNCKSGLHIWWILWRCLGWYPLSITWQDSGLLVEIHWEGLKRSLFLISRWFFGWCIFLSSRYFPYTFYSNGFCHAIQTCNGISTSSFPSSFPFTVIYFLIFGTISQALFTLEDFWLNFGLFPRVVILYILQLYQIARVICVYGFSYWNIHL